MIYSIFLVMPSSIDYSLSLVNAHLSTHKNPAVAVGVVTYRVNKLRVLKHIM